MRETEKAIENLNIAKNILCNQQMLTSEMCIRIGQAITDAISLLKEQEAEEIRMAAQFADELEKRDHIIEELKPKTARWEKRTGMMPPEYHGHYWCSNCDWHGKYNEREIDYKFCPACGAKMEG